MSVERVIEVMTELILEHQALVAVAEEKTEVIKKSDMDALSRVLMKERKLVQIISKLEDTCQTAVSSFFNTEQVTNVEKTVSNLMSFVVDGEMKQRLEEKATTLLEEILKLKQIEHLNRDLIEQSLAFIQVSLDMMQPTMKNMNYSADNHQHQPLQQTSVFDSRA